MERGQVEPVSRRPRQRGGWSHSRDAGPPSASPCRGLLTIADVGIDGIARLRKSLCRPSRDRFSAAADADEGRSSGDACCVRCRVCFDRVNAGQEGPTGRCGGQGSCGQEGQGTGGQDVWLEEQEQERQSPEVRSCGLAASRLRPDSALSDSPLAFPLARAPLSRSYVSQLESASASSSEKDRRAALADPNSKESKAVCRPPPPRGSAPPAPRPAPGLCAPTRWP